MYIVFHLSTPIPFFSICQLCTCKRVTSLSLFHLFMYEPDPLNNKQSHSILTLTILPDHPFVYIWVCVHACVAKKKEMHRMILLWYHTNICSTHDPIARCSRFSHSALHELAHGSNECATMCRIANHMSLSLSGRSIINSKLSPHPYFFINVVWTCSNDTNLLLKRIYRACTHLEKQNGSAK